MVKIPPPLNFAHGDLYMVGAYIGSFVIQRFGGASALSIPVPLLLVIMFALAAGLVGGLGMAIERFAYRPLRDAPQIAPRSASRSSWRIRRCCCSARSSGSTTRRKFIKLPSGIQVSSVTIDSVQIMVVVLGVALMAGLPLLVNRTRLGKQIRAVAGDRETAEMLGINVNFTIAATFFLGSALAGVAGSWPGCCSTR